MGLEWVKKLSRIGTYHLKWFLNMLGSRESYLARNVAALSLFIICMRGHFQAHVNNGLESVIQEANHGLFKWGNSAFRMSRRTRHTR